MLRAPDVYACACLNLTVIFVCRVSIDTPRAPLTPVVSVDTSLQPDVQPYSRRHKTQERGEMGGELLSAVCDLCLSCARVQGKKKFYTAYGKHTLSTQRQPHTHTVPYMSTHVPIFPRARCKLRHRWDAIRHQIS